MPNFFMKNESAEEVNMQSLSHRKEVWWGCRGI